MKPKPKFKVGNQVKVLKCGRNCGFEDKQHSVGKIGKLDNNKPNWLLVEFPDHTNCIASKVQLLPKKVEKKEKVCKMCKGEGCPTNVKLVNGLCPHCAKFPKSHPTPKKPTKGKCKHLWALLDFKVRNDHSEARVFCQYCTEIKDI